MHTKREWFASWFDTPYYHILYKHRDYTEAENFVKKIITHLNPPNESKLLDLACGKGRHAKVMADMGYHVTGVDLSQQSIDAAKEMETINLHFDVHDMREVYKESNFDYVFNLFTSFGYFDNEKDNERVLKAIHAMLSENGTLVIDFMNVFKVAPNLRRQEIKKIDDIEFRIKRNIEGKHIVKKIEFQIEDKWHHYEERVQGLNVHDFERLFSETNFEIKEVFGDYDLGLYSKNTSNRLIMVVQKV